MIKRPTDSSTKSSRASKSADGSLISPSGRTLHLITRESREAVLGPGVGIQSRHRFWLYAGFSALIVLIVALGRLFALKR